MENETVFQNMEGFEYVIKKQERHKICFGSGCPRDTSKKGMSPFMKHYALEDHPNTAPNLYNALESFKAVTTKPCSHSISKKGYSGIARFGNQVIRNDDYPSPSTYTICTFPKQANKSKYPFASTSKRNAFLENQNPGPGMYVITKKGGIIFKHSFGGRVQMQLGVDLKCCSRNLDVCRLCGEKPTGDYWHLNNQLFLCRMCMNKEFAEEQKYKRAELNQFRKVRDCSIIHQHEGTDAKVWLTHPASVAQWARREAYLSSYIKG